MRLMLRYQPDLREAHLSRRYWAVGAKTRELNELLFEHGMNPSQPDWLGITPLHHFARKGDVENAALFSTMAPICTRATKTSVRRRSAGRPSSARLDGRVPPATRRKTEPARRSAVGHAAGVGHPARARSRGARAEGV